MVKEHQGEEGTSTKEENAVETEAEPSPEEKVAEEAKTEPEADAGKAKKPEKEKVVKAKAPAAKKPVKEKVVIPVERTKPLRERKQVEKFVVTPFKKVEEDVVILQGKGLPLKDIPNVVYKLGKIPRTEDLLSVVHNLMYKKRGKQQTLKKNILDFSGYVWEDEEKDRQAVTERLDRYPKEVVAEVLDLFDLPVGGKKGELVSRAIEFLEKPSIANTVLLEEKEAKKKGKKAAKRPRSKKAAKPAKKDTGEEEEEAEDDVEEEEHEEEAPAKKKARGTPVKAAKKAAAKSPAKAKAKVVAKPKKASKPVKEKVTPKKAAKEEAAQDSDDDDDAPLVKPKSDVLKPSNQELAEAVKEILETADLEKMSKKFIRKQLAEKFSLEDDIRKDEINKLINEGVAAKQEAQEAEEAE